MATMAEPNPKFDYPKNLECDGTDGHLGEYELDGVKSYDYIEDKDLKKKTGGYHVDITLDVLSRRCKITEEDRKHLWETYRLYTAKISQKTPYICCGHFREDG